MNPAAEGLPPLMPSKDEVVIESPSPSPSPIREREKTGIKKALAAVALGLAAFAFTTWRALEGREVVVLRTFGPDGAARETRTWVADEDGFAWIESANAERPFYRHILANPYIEMVRAGATRGFLATPVPNPEGHLRIRRLLAERYGWADRWIALLADTSGSIAIRLEPSGAPPRR